MPKGALPPRGEVNQLAKVTAETTTASPRVLMDEAGVEEGTRLWDRGYALPGSPFVLSASDGQSKETPMFV